MAAERPRRSNAGARMDKLLQDEDEDEFYKTTYGGFDEEGEDNDYASEGSGHDIVDSDFDMDEADEIRSDIEDGTENKRKRKSTKGYKEPVAKKAKTEVTKASKERRPKPKPSSVQIYHQSEAAGRLSLRASTQARSEESGKSRELRLKAERDFATKKNVAVDKVRRLTQEELLEEAKVTERENLKSLQQFRRLELKRKRAMRAQSKTHVPMITYRSVTMPLLNDDGTETNERCSRTFISLTQEDALDDVFAQKKPKLPPKHFCPLRSQASLAPKYLDPLTNTAFHTCDDFRRLREILAANEPSYPEYKRQLELVETCVRQLRDRPSTGAGGAQLGRAAVQRHLSLPLARSHTQTN